MATRAGVDGTTASPWARRRSSAPLVFVSLSLSLLGVTRAALGADPSPPPPKPADAAPSASDAAEGKRHFLLGLELYKQQVFDAALAEFEQSYALGKRPTALRNVAQCHRELKQFAEAYDALERLLTVHASQLKDSEKTDIQAALGELAKVTATLSLSVSVAGAQVTVNGKDVGVSPLNGKLRLNVGAHKVRASKQGYDPAELDISLLVRQDASEQLVLKATAVAPVAPVLRGVLGHLRIKAAPYTADILIDGERVAAGKFEGDVSEGDHALDVSASGFVSAHRTFRVAGGQSAVENVALDPFVPEKPVVQSPIARLYGAFNLALLRHVNGYQPLLTACGDPLVQCNQPSYPTGAGVLHVGYTLNWLSIEFVGAFSVEVRSEALNAEGAATPPAGCSWRRATRYATSRCPPPGSRASPGSDCAPRRPTRSCGSRPGSRRGSRSAATPSPGPSRTAWT